MRRMAAVLLLVLLAPAVAELSIGDLPFTAAGATGFVVLVPLYGGGAVLVRELVRRRSSTGWPAILVLGACYGLLEEGLALQSLFSPTIYHGLGPEWGVRVLGVNGVYTVVQLINHAVWSVAVPIALTDLAFPRLRTGPLLGKPGLVVTGLVYLLGLGVTASSRGRLDPHYSTPPGVLVGLFLGAVAVAVVALLATRRRGGRVRTAARPRPTVVFLVGLIAGVVVLAVLAWPAHWWPALLHGPAGPGLIVSCLAIAGAVGVLVRRWAGSSGWDDLRLLALTAGVLLGHTVAWAPLQARTGPDRWGVAVLFVLTAVLLGLLARAVRRRAAAPAARSPAVWR